MAQKFTGFYNAGKAKFLCYLLLNGDDHEVNNSNTALMSKYLYDVSFCVDEQGLWGFK